MPYPFSITVKEYRSIQNRALIPLSQKSTFIVGQNNSGKTNILRALSSIFNKNDKKRRNENIKFDLKIKDRNSLASHIPSALQDAMTETDLEFSIDNFTPTKDQPSQSLIRYINSGMFLENFGISSGFEENKQRIYNRIFETISENYFLGTIYAPTTRFINKPGNEPQHFSENDMRGTTLNYGDIIEKLSEMDRPSGKDRHTLRQSFNQIEYFLQYCLEKRNVKIQVPNDKTTIHVAIDDVERPIQELGTGVEQLIIIGLATFGFQNKLVLIDEPELHFHPRAQKRMISYLNERVDANFVFATHSAAILDAVEADILQVTYENNQSIVRTLTSNTLKYQAVRDMGYSPSDIIQSRFAIWVEGPSDRIYIKNWIGKIAPELEEGVDYTILFYGGKILSHHSFKDADEFDEQDLLKALSLSRSFAVVMDSDRHANRARLNETKLRVEAEVTEKGGFCWITNGREIENYIPDTIIQKLMTKYPETNLPETKNDQVITSSRTKKSDYARDVVKEPTDEWPLDLKKKVEQLVDAIRAAK